MQYHQTLLYYSMNFLGLHIIWCSQMPNNASRKSNIFSCWKITHPLLWRVHVDWHRWHMHIHHIAAASNDDVITCFCYYKYFITYLTTPTPTPPPHYFSFLCHLLWVGAPCLPANAVLAPPVLPSICNHLFRVCSKPAAASVNVSSLCLETLRSCRCLPRNLTMYGSRSIRWHIGHSVWKALEGGSTKLQSYPPNVSFSLDFRSCGCCR